MRYWEYNTGKYVRSRTPQTTQGKIPLVSDLIYHMQDFIIKKKLIGKPAKTI
jgi:hypothetical protein